jgi:NAD(P)-dependent dehydrogenase (short-subunit alcohol dehydrogenase family)
MASNHLGHFLLVQLLMPILSASVPTASPLPRTYDVSVFSLVHLHPTALLLVFLLQGTRVVVVSSTTHWLAGADAVTPVEANPHFIDGESAPFITGFIHYGASKLQNVLFAYELEKKFEGTVVICTPGHTRTHTHTHTHTQTHTHTHTHAHIHTHTHTHTCTHTHTHTQS